MEMATVFLSPPVLQYDKNNSERNPDESIIQSSQPPRLQNKLRLCFKDFSKK